MYPRGFDRPVGLHCAETEGRAIATRSDLFHRLGHAESPTAYQVSGWIADGASENPVAEPASSRPVTTSLAVTRTTSSSATVASQARAGFSGRERAAPHNGRATVEAMLPEASPANRPQERPEICYNPLTLAIGWEISWRHGCWILRSLSST